MASLDVADSRSRSDFFQQSILNNLHYWQTWLDQNLTQADAVDRERNSLVRAISFAFHHQTAWPAVFELVTTLSPLMERRGHWDTWQWVLSRAVAVAQQFGYRADEVTLSALLARLLFQQGRHPESVQTYRRVIRLARQIGDTFNEARAYTNLGYHYVERGRWHRAEVLCCHALMLFEQLDSDHGRAHTENHLGILFTRQGQWAEAEQHLERACAIWGEMRDQHGLMRGFSNLCLLYNSMELPDKALLLAEKAFRQADITGEELVKGRIHLNAGTAHRLKGQLAEAEAHTREAERIFRNLSDTHGVVNALSNLGEIYLCRQEWTLATTYLREALEGYRQLKNKPGEIQTIIHLAKFESRQGHKSEAQFWLNEAEDQLKQYPQAGGYNHLPEQIKMIRRNSEEQSSSRHGVST